MGFDLQIVQNNIKLKNMASETSHHKMLLRSTTLLGKLFNRIFLFSVSTLTPHIESEEIRSIIPPSTAF